MRVPVVRAGVTAWLALAARRSTVEPEHPPASTHSGSSQTGSVVLASIVLAVAVVAPGGAVLTRRTT